MSLISGMIRTMAAVPCVHLANPAKNAEEISSLLDIADQCGVKLCVFPELSLTGSTCGDLFAQPALLDGARDALYSLLQKGVKTAFVVGLPLMLGGQLHACAAVIAGKQLTLVPVNGHARPFAPAAAAPACVTLFGQTVPVVRNPVFDCGSFTFGLFEDCGAQIIAYPYACAAIAGQHARIERRFLQESDAQLCAMVCAGAGYGESTSDMVFPGHAGVYECGELLAQNNRFARSASYAIADVDVQRILFKRSTQPVSAQGTAVPLPACEGKDDALIRPLSPLPFLPKDGEEDAFLLDALAIQAQGLIRRMEHIRTKKLVLGVSGGLDSTLALLSAAYAYELCGWDKSGIVGITMPGFGTGTRTKSNAEKLMERIGCTMLTIPIGPAVTQHFSDIGQSMDVHDICYENSQARERTQIIMDYANKIGALVLGTGDLSEVALGWCTYNGDHMSMYNLNGSVPKTLMRSMVAYAARLLGETIVPVAQDIIDTPVSPELLPGVNGEIAQKTEETLGAYELHDFFLWHMMDSGASPRKLYALACQAFEGQQPREEILRALKTFVRRFFTQQFKRSAMPDGPQVTPVSLSPRGGWQMPSDAQMQLWMNEVESIKA